MKKGVLYLLIATFAIGAFLGIGIIILDLWNELTLKVMLTTVTIFGFSVPALCSATLFDKSNEKVFPIIGVAISVIACIYTLLLIWGFLEYDIFDEGITKWLVELMILSASFGHISLLLLVDSKDNTVLMVRNGTIIISIAFDILITLSIFVEDFTDYVTWQYYAIMAILIVLGTIVTPIFNKARPSMVVNKEEVINNNAKAKLDDLLKDKYVTEEEYKTILSRINNKK